MQQAGALVELVLVARRFSGPARVEAATSIRRLLEASWNIRIDPDLLESIKDWPGDDDPLADVARDIIWSQTPLHAEPPGADTADGDAQSDGYRDAVGEAADRTEADRTEAARTEAARTEAARTEAARTEAARAEAERLAAERLAAAERVALERVALERHAAERVAVERFESERAAAERAEYDHAAAESAEYERAAASTPAAATQPAASRRPTPPIASAPVPEPSPVGARRGLDIGRLRDRARDALAGLGGRRSARSKPQPVPKNGGGGTHAEPPTGAEPSPESPTVATGAAAHNAYGLLRAPAEVVVGEAFVLDVGLSERPAEGVAGPPLDLPPLEDRPYVVDVRIAAAGFTFPRGEKRRHELKVSAMDPYPVVPVRLVPKATTDKSIDRRITAEYSIAGERLGDAIRSIRVLHSADLRTRPEGEKVAVGANVPAPTGEEVADLTITIRRSDRLGWIDWTFDTPHLDVARPTDAPTPKEIGDPVEFLRSQVRQISDAEERGAGGIYGDVLGLARTVGASRPDRDLDGDPRSRGESWCATDDPPRLRGTVRPLGTCIRRGADRAGPGRAALPRGADTDRPVGSGHGAGGRALASVPEPATEKRRDEPRRRLGRLLRHGMVEP